jgi:hypothetical protein
MEQVPPPEGVPMTTYTWTHETSYLKSRLAQEARKVGRLKKRLKLERRKRKIIKKALKEISSRDVNQISYIRSIAVCALLKAKGLE